MLSCIDVLLLVYQYVDNCVAAFKFINVFCVMTETRPTFIALIVQFKTSNEKY